MTERPMHPAPSIQERFEDFDAKHPEVFEAFRDVAEQLLANGHRHYSADAVVHVVRLHRAFFSASSLSFRGSAA
jgi:hypothetical protein